MFLVKVCKVVECNAFYKLWYVCITYVEHDTEMAEFPRTGTQQYMQHIVIMENDVRALENRKAHMACLQYLKVLHLSILVYCIAFLCTCTLLRKI